ncbi:hypothetical protein F5148DRAFT_1312122 [Russula earlei]|uniref:Uncharacterized protein n=1 Tax=Russula earlei TaxID=71964 RepID=A0ACC0UJY9_9AGAM|nr:hypothetical protein F5148DRAFT_1312122 [Russula earlei]
MQKQKLIYDIISLSALTQEEVIELNAGGLSLHALFSWAHFNLSVSVDRSNWTWTLGRRDTAPNKWKAFAEGARKFQPETGVFNLGKLPSIYNTTAFVRECYLEAEKVVWRQASLLCEAEAVSPGKTYFLWYLLIRLLQANQIILFAVDGHSPILFYFDGIYVLNDPLSEEYLPENINGGFLWLLFDTPGGSFSFPPVAYSTTCFPIQAPSPNPALYFTWRKCRRPVYTAFPIWSIEELKKGLELDRDFGAFKISLHGENPPRLEEAIDDILNNVVSYLGYVPQDIFRAVLSDFQDIHNDVMVAINKSPEDLGPMLRMVVGGEDFSKNQTSHRLIVVNPRRAVALKFKEYEEQSVRKLISYLKSVPQGATLAPWLFEVYAHRKIVGSVGVQRLGEPLREMTFHSDTFKPSAPNFPLIDAFIITHDDNQITIHLWVLQMTTSKMHIGSPKGYDKIREIIDTLLPQPEDTNVDRQATQRPTQPSSRLPDSSPPKKKQKKKAAASSSTGQLTTVKVHYVLVCPRDPPGSNEMREWILPKGWNDNIAGDGYLLEIPLNVRLLEAFPHNH